jgi:threonylcarbamoyladenosine tRNA methylthiotransferase MtaB
MPQVNGAVAKARAARLRAEGELALARYLASQTGQTRQILTETPRMGRTEHFAEVRFESDQPEGQIVTARITGFAGQQLIA